jgi:hypothetical protein
MPPPQIIGPNATPAPALLRPDLLERLRKWARENTPFVGDPALSRSYPQIVQPQSITHEEYMRRQQQLGVTPGLGLPALSNSLGPTARGTQADPFYVRPAGPEGYGIGGGAGAQASLQATNAWGRNVTEPARHAFPEGILDLPKNVTEAVRAAAGIFKLNQNWMAALARAEGGVDAQGRPRTSSAGAIGVMQLMPGTAAGLGVNPRNQNENITGGMRYFQQMLALFHGNYGAATAAYNWGPGKAESQHRAILERFAQTGDPSQLPLQTQQYLRRIQQGAGAPDGASPVKGAVDVNVNIRGAPPGTTSSGRSSGILRAPKVSHAMDFYGV